MSSAFRRIMTGLLSMVLALLGIAAVSVAVAPSANAAPINQYGHWIGGKWFGSIKESTTGRIVVCIDKSKPYKVSTLYLQSTVTNESAANANAQAVLAFYHGSPTNADDGLAWNGAAMIIDNPTGYWTKVFLNSGYTSAKAKAKLWASQAKSWSTPYAPTPVFVSKPLPGNAGSAGVVVKAKSGASLPAMTVTLKGINLTVPSTARTSTVTPTATAGTKFSIKRSTSTAQPDLRATTPALSSGMLYTNRLSSTYQRLIGKGTSKVYTGHTGYQRLPNAPTLSYTCVNCKSTIDSQVCNTQPETIKYAILLDGALKEEKTLVKGACGTITVPGYHTAKVTVTWSVINGTTATTPLKFAISLIVDCPEWLVIQQYAEAGCETEYLWTDFPINTTHARQQLLVNGTVVQDVMPGQDLPKVEYHPTCGNAESFAITARAQKLDGSWVSTQQLLVTFK